MAVLYRTQICFKYTIKRRQSADIHMNSQIEKLSTSFRYNVKKEFYRPQQYKIRHTYLPTCWQ